MNSSGVADHGVIHTDTCAMQPQAAIRSRPVPTRTSAAAAAVVSVQHVPRLQVDGRPPLIRHGPHPTRGGLTTMSF